jgi:ketosteroid isomerase-like protein
LTTWIDAVNRRDFDAAFATVGPDTEWVVAREHPAAKTHRGPAAIRAYLEEWLTAMPDMRIELDDVEEAGDSVLALLRVAGSGTGSGAPSEIRLATITEYSGDEALRTREFLDVDEARREFEKTHP